MHSCESLSRYEIVSREWTAEPEAFLERSAALVPLSLSLSLFPPRYGLLTLKVLKATPGTVLWLLDGGETARVNLRREAKLAGVEEERLVFAPLVSKREHLRRLRLADLFVDTPVRTG